MIVQQTHRRETAGASFPGPSDVADPQAITEQARVIIASQSQETSGRKLRNRILLVNAAAWLVIIVAVRMIFF